MQQKQRSQDPVSAFFIHFTQEKENYYAKKQVSGSYFYNYHGIFMVYAMICYNIALNKGGMTNEVFLLAFHELVIMGPIAFILDFFLYGHLAKKIAFGFINPAEAKQYEIILAISSVTVCLMCPTMSFAATLLFSHAGSEFVAVWFQKTALNFPMAFFWQIFFAGPVVRRIFGLLFKNAK